MSDDNTADLYVDGTDGQFHLVVQRHAPLSDSLVSFEVFGDPNRTIDVSHVVPGVEPEGEPSSVFVVATDGLIPVEAFVPILRMAGYKVEPETKNSPLGPLRVDPDSDEELLRPIGLERWAEDGVQPSVDDDDEDEDDEALEEG